MNKYMQRTIEPGAFWFVDLDPENETDEQMIAKIPKEEWPFMLKNTSLSLGRGVYRCPDPDYFRKIMSLYRNSP